MRLIKNTGGDRVVDELRQCLAAQDALKFQRDGVIGAIDKLERFGGCIIADSVGLGKTFEALAIIKYFELRNDLLTIARSRKHIERYYGTHEMGRFPERLKPVNIKPDVDQAGEFRSIREINNEIRRLTLAAYSPLRYGLPDAGACARFDRATAAAKERLVFVKGDDSGRHAKMQALVRKAGNQVVRRRFASMPELTSLVYASLVEYLVAPEPSARGPSMQRPVPTPRSTTFPGTRSGSSWPVLKPNEITLLAPGRPR